MKIKRGIIFSIILLFGLLESWNVSAADSFISFDDLYAAVQQLQNQIQALQNQIANLNSQVVRLETAQIKFTRTLKIGSQGSDVKQTQEYLKLFPGIYPEGLVTGNYGTLTSRAVKRFQKIYSLPETGIVDEKTGKQLKDNIVQEIKARMIAASQITGTVSSSILTSITATSTSLATSSELAASSTSEETANYFADIIDMSDVPPPEESFYALSSPPATTLPTSTTSSTDVFIASTATTSSATASTTTTNSSSITSVAPFSISNLSVNNISKNGARFSWDTSTSSDSEVYYGLTQSYTNSQTQNKLVTNHSISISNLSKNTTYHFHVQSKDAAGDTVVSGDQTFTTQD